MYTYELSTLHLMICRAVYGRVTDQVVPKNLRGLKYSKARSCLQVYFLLLPAYIFSGRDPRVDGYFLYKN